jgi:hypothetical protein
MSRGQKKVYRHNDLSTVKCTTEGCNRRIKMRLVVEFAMRGDKTPLKCYHCTHPKRKANKIFNKAKRAAQKGVKVMRMGEDTIA